MKQYIIDDLGMHWGYSFLRGRIYCIEAEVELIEKYGYNSLEVWENGYYADSLKDGRQVLIEFGYITI